MHVQIQHYHMKQMITKRWWRIALVSLYGIAFAAITWTWLRRIGAFGCFDDCFNFGAGYFLLQGKQLYSQIFFNHQPFMAYVSACVQFLSHPQTLFELVKYHRIVGACIAGIFGIGLIIRFGSPLFFALLVFESTKFYLFGDRFLAESIIVYPMIYMTLILWNGMTRKSVKGPDLVLSAVCSWFVFWMREPFAPWSIAMFLAIVFLTRQKPAWKRTGMACWILLHILVVCFLPIREYIYNVVTVNSLYELGVQSWDWKTISQILFYPVWLIIKGPAGSILQPILFTVSCFFVLGFCNEIRQKHKNTALGVVVVLLALANLRVTKVGAVFYEAFHMVPWYGLIISMMSVWLFDLSVDKKTRVIGWMLFAIIAAGNVYSFFLPTSYWREHVETATEFNNNYATYFVKGDLIKKLAKPGDTMFVEMWEDPIYITAGVPTAYTYSWYTSVMPYVEKYRIAREFMFTTHPPTFYAGACRPGEFDSFALDAKTKGKYVQILSSGKPTCVYMIQSDIDRISATQQEFLKKNNYSLPVSEH